MESLRPLLTTYAYNILGSIEEAEDIVQDAFARFTQTDKGPIEDMKAYLVRIVINLSINRKKRQQRIVAEYPGPWLPEPVATERADTGLLREEVLSYSLLVLLEKLDPRQRAVFILAEAFDYSHDEIGKVLDITAAHSRKILSRARGRLQDDNHLREKAPADYLDKYLDVITRGDTGSLEKLLREDIAVISDGGGKATAFRKPITGRYSVLRLLLGLQSKFNQHARLEKHLVNHQPALFYYVDDKLVTCQVFSLAGGRIGHLFFIRNPDKLAGLDMRATPGRGPSPIRGARI